MLLLASVTCAITIWFAVDFLRGTRSLAALASVPPLEPQAPAPMVSVIIPARNEAASIREALTSVLGQTYPDFEVLVVDDRSEDDTARLVEELGRTHPRLQLLRVASLPPRWLGKNHACWLGARQARGTLHLFTDADVIFDPTTLSRAVRYFQRHRLDHLALTPRVDVQGLALQAFVTGFLVNFCAVTRPWKARDPKSRHSIGIGAFGLIHAEVYRAVGTHEALAMRPDDDMRLGQLIKRQGFRQDAVNGADLVRVRWYGSLPQAVEGLMKNSFAFFGYRPERAALALLGMAVMSLWPLAALVLTWGAVYQLNLLTVLATLAVFAESARANRFRLVVALGYPFATAVLMYVVARAAVMTLSQGGIRWRGTLYPLGDLRQGR